MIFTLIALDKIHYARGPDILSNPAEIIDERRRHALPVINTSVVAHGGDPGSHSTAVPPKLILRGVDDHERIEDALKVLVEKSTSPDRRSEEV